MNKADSCIILPNHWLVNAGIIGLLELLRDQGGLKEKVEELLREDGGIDGEELRLLLDKHFKEVNTPYGDMPEILWWYLTYRRHGETLFPFNSGSPSSVVTSLFFKVPRISPSPPYQNLVNPSSLKGVSESAKGKEKVRLFVKEFSHGQIFCSSSSNKDACELTGWTKYQIKSLDARWLSYLFPSHKGFPNSFRSGQKEGCIRVAAPVAYLIPLHHLAFTLLEKDKVQDGGVYHVYGFINAPSFLVMYHLNRLLRQYGLSGGAKEAFAWSLISYYLRTKRMLTKWVYQNAELILRRETFTKGGKEVSIDTLSIPAEVAALLEDAEVRKRIHKIGSVEVLKAVLSKRHDILEKKAYEELRSSIKEATEERKNGSHGEESSSSSERNSSAEKAKDLIFLLGAIREFERKRLLSAEWEI